jgi:hypothetical protein
VLQDSWAHQGKPKVAKIGHFRGARWKRLSGGRGKWVRTDGSWRAAASKSADKVHLWPISARWTGFWTYQALKKFRERCGECYCPGKKGGTKQKISTGKEPAKDKEIRDMLWDKFPGSGVELL